MKDSIEEFIEMHRDEFDEHDLPEHVWQSVQKKLQPKNGYNHSNALALAASLLLIVGSFAWFNKTVPYNKQQEIKAIAVSPDIREAETYYTGLIGAQCRELEQYKNQYPDLYTDLQKEINTLNTYYAALKVEYVNSSDKEVIKQSMIENLQSRAQIAGRQLEIIQHIKGNENNENAS